MRISRWRRMNAGRDHRWSRSRMSAYLEGELAARQHRRLAQHEELCPECWRVLRTLDALLLILPTLRIPPQTTVDVVQRTAAQARARIGEWGE
ncbi:MAG TPA: zf-HC2 domain-containing protein [Solirubrobacterales bacterium]|nr:zf-HC2 domain-containing protein [Solirubrobacterales bacterium]